MADKLCSVCTNLDYDFFVKAHGTDLDDDLTRPRYLLIDFDDLQDAAIMGCTICNILNQGIRLFWGDNLEEIYSGYHKGYTLILKRSWGMGLLAFEESRQNWDGNLNCPLYDSIEFFTPPSRSLLCVIYVVDGAFIRTSLNHL